MSLFFADLVRELSRSTGAGDFALEGAVPGHRRFDGVVPAGERFCYAIAGITNTGEWEVGEGEIGSGGALVRSPLASSAGGGLVAFTAGLKTVALTVGASWFAEQDDAVADVAALQAAIEGKADLGHDHDGTYQPLNAGLTAIAGLASAADRLPYFTGSATAALTTLSAFGRGLIDDADAVAARATLGLGSAASRNTGNSGANVPLLDGTNSWSAAQSVAGAVTLSASGVDIATGARLVTPSMRCEATSPSITIKDTDSAGAAMTGYFHFWDSGNVTTARIGRPFGDGNLWIENAGGTIHFGLAIGTSAAQLNAASFDLLGGRAFRVAGSQVVGPRIGGWSAATGTASRGAFDTATVSTAALAERVKALIDDLRTHGLIGN